MPSPEAFAWYDLGEAAFSRGAFAQAAEAYRKALSLGRPFPEAANNLGNALMLDGFYGEALASYLEADCPDAWVNASVPARILGFLDQARELLERAIRDQPRHNLAYASLGNLLKDQGRVDLALASYRTSLALDPDNAITHGNLAYMLTFDPEATPEDILRETRAWQARHAAGLQPRPHDRRPGGRLRIGYVSPDFRYHCQAFFTLPLFASHDRKAFEIFAYSSVLKPDAVTAHLEGLCDVWRNCAGMTDEAVAELVREDGIDILVDLTMHMSNGRPLLFARKPAPIQVAWLAYPGTTGLDAMDCRFTDPWLDPPGEHDAWYAERSIRLPDTFWCYHPLTEEPQPGPLPALERGHVTFGCLNNFCKVNPGVLALWERVLDAVPGSRLLLMANPGRHREEVLSRLRDPGRVDFTPFQPRQSYLELYRQVDLCLDTFPYNGHTTSLDATWMGVPVVTRVGRTVVGRAGWSQLNNLGLPELAAWDDEAFVATAAGLALDLPRLADLRAGLRARMAASPLMDAERFARGVEAAYRTLAGVG